MGVYVRVSICEHECMCVYVNVRILVCDIAVLRQGCFI